MELGRKYNTNFKKKCMIWMFWNNNDHLCVWIITLYSIKYYIIIMITQPLVSFSCPLWTNWRCQNIQSEWFMGLFRINSSWSLESEYMLAPGPCSPVGNYIQCHCFPVWQSAYFLTDLVVTIGRLWGAACHSTQSVAGTKCFFISSCVY